MHALELILGLMSLLQLLSFSQTDNFLPDFATI